MRAIVCLLLCLGVVGCESRSASVVSPSAPSIVNAPRSVSAFRRVEALDVANPRYCLLITIDDTDSRNNVIGTIRGNGSVFDLIEGRDAEPNTTPTIWNRYVLKPSLLPVGTPELPVQGGVMINSDVPAVVRNEYSQDTTLWWTVELGAGQNPTRAEMQTRLKTEAYHERLCTHYWQIVPGDSLSVAAAGQPGDLLSKFAPLP